MLTELGVRDPLPLGSGDEHGEYSISSGFAKRSMHSFNGTEILGPFLALADFLLGTPSGS